MNRDCLSLLIPGGRKHKLISLGGFHNCSAHLTFPATESLLLLAVSQLRQYRIYVSGDLVEQPVPGNLGPACALGAYTWSEEVKTNGTGTAVIRIESDDRPNEPLIIAIAIGQTLFQLTESEGIVVQEDGGDQPALIDRLSTTGWFRNLALSPTEVTGSLKTGETFRFKFKNYVARLDVFDYRMPAWVFIVCLLWIPFLLAGWLFAGTPHFGWLWVCSGITVLAAAGVGWFAPYLRRQTCVGRFMNPVDPDEDLDELRFWQLIYLTGAYAYLAHPDHPDLK